MRLVQGYGLTETSPVISVLTDPAKTGSVGRPLPGVEVGIADDGEILTRGPHVMLGYRNRPEATAETIRDGWLHTGDLGRIDDDGYLAITGGRKADRHGRRQGVAPVLLESLLSRERLILQSMVIGDGRNYLNADRAGRRRCKRPGSGDSPTRPRNRVWPIRRCRLSTRSAFASNSRAITLRADRGTFAGQPFSVERELTPT